jgi:hypothetical protein
MRRCILVTLSFLCILAACSPPGRSLEESIVGRWVNVDGYEIVFLPNGEGQFPGYEESIEASDFTYQIIDDTHVMIEYLGVEYAIEIVINGDTLIWIDRLGEVKYSRVE